MRNLIDRIREALASNATDYVSRPMSDQLEREWAKTWWVQ